MNIFFVVVICFLFLPPPIYIYIYIYISISPSLSIMVSIYVCTLLQIFDGFTRLSYTIRLKTGIAFLCFAIRVLCWGNYMYIYAF